MLLATASAAAFEISSTGRTMTWLRTPTRPLSRRYPRKVVEALTMAMAFPMCVIGDEKRGRLPALGLDVVDVGVLPCLDGLDHLEIRRASCRERVCQFV